MKIFGFLLETAPYVFWIAHPTGYPTYRSFSIKKILYNICLLCLGLSVYLLLPILTILATMEYYFEIYKINFPWVIIFVSIAGFVAGFREIFFNFITIQKLI